MNAEQAIEVLESGEWWDALPDAKTIETYNREMELHAAVDTAIAALREQAKSKAKHDICPNPCEFVKRVIDKQAERENGCEWCRNMGEYDRFEYNRIDADGHSEVHAHVVVSNLARYCPNCGARMDKEDT